ncbi:MAG: MarR family transcriptional regulator [Gemmatimonadota bacterium]
MITDHGDLVARVPEVGDREPALRLWVVLSRAYESIADRLRSDVARHDLTLTEFGILEVLYHKGPLLLGEVQRRILVSSGGVTYLVDRLERKGFVERRACPEDRRARYAALTDAGEALIAEIFPQHAECIRELMGELTADEQVAAHGMLKRLGLSAVELERRCGSGSDTRTSQGEVRG